MYRPTLNLKVVLIKVDPQKHPPLTKVVEDFQNKKAVIITKQKTVSRVEWGKRPGVVKRLWHF